MAYLDLMNLCWSADPSQRPTSDQIVSLTQPNVDANAKTRTENMGVHDHVSAKVDPGFSTIRAVFRLDCLQTVTCATVGKFCYQIRFQSHYNMS